MPHQWDVPRPFLDLLISVRKDLHSQAVSTESITRPCDLKQHDILISSRANTSRPMQGAPQQVQCSAHHCLSGQMGLNGHHWHEVLEAPPARLFGMWQP